MSQALQNHNGPSHASRSIRFHSTLGEDAAMGTSNRSICTNCYCYRLLLILDKQLTCKAAMASPKGRTVGDLCKRVVLFLLE